MWNVRMVSWVPGSPMDWAAMMPDGFPEFDPRPSGQVASVAVNANPLFAFAGQHGTDLDALDARGFDLAGFHLVDLLIGPNQDFLRALGIGDVVAGMTADEAFAQA